MSSYTLNQTLQDGVGEGGGTLAHGKQVLTELKEEVDKTSLDDLD